MKKLTKKQRDYIRKIAVKVNVSNIADAYNLTKNQVLKILSTKD